MIVSHGLLPGMLILKVQTDLHKETIFSMLVHDLKRKEAREVCIHIVPLDAPYNIRKLCT